MKPLVQVDPEAETRTFVLAKAGELLWAKVEVLHVHVAVDAAKLQASEVERLVSLRSHFSQQSPP